MSVLSSELVDEEFIGSIFGAFIEVTLEYYRMMGDYELEPMGSSDDMKNNMPKIAGSILRACRTYYDTPSEQLVQIISSITIGHYLVNRNKRTVVSAGILYLINYIVTTDVLESERTNWTISKINYLKIIADEFANCKGDAESLKQRMIKFAEEEIFTNT